MDEAEEPLLVGNLKCQKSARANIYYINSSTAIFFQPQPSSKRVRFSSSNCPRPTIPVNALFCVKELRLENLRRL